MQKWLNFEKYILFLQISRNKYIRNNFDYMKLALRYIIQSKQINGYISYVLPVAFDIDCTDYDDADGFPEDH